MEDVRSWLQTLSDKEYIETFRTTKGVAAYITAKGQLEVRSYASQYRHMQYHLTSFDEVFQEAYKILESLQHDHGSLFRMVAATPIFGVELRSEVRERWRGLLVGRIEGGCPTEIVCLDWRLRNNAIHSPLGNFCRALSQFLELSTEDAELLYQTATSHTEFFEHLLSNRNPFFKLKLGDDPPFSSSSALHHLVLEQAYYTLHPRKHYQRKCPSSESLPRTQR